MKTFVINLKNAADRRARMSEMLQTASSLEVEFTQAVNGSRMTPAEREKYFDIGGGICGTCAKSDPER